MPIRLICIGKFNDPGFRELHREYEDRIKRYSRFEVVEINPSKANQRKSIDAIKLSEYEMVMKHIKVNDSIILLDEKGKRYTSRKLADFIQQQMNYMSGDLVFVLGGAYGFAADMYARAIAKVSMSDLTFPHQLARVVFTEQLYRSFTILNNEPYHHD